MDQSLIEFTFIDYFQTKYATSNPTFPCHLENLFERKILDKENELLIAIPSEDEVLAALKQIMN